MQGKENLTICLKQILDKVTACHMILVLEAFVFTFVCHYSSNWNTDLLNYLKQCNQFKVYEKQILIYQLTFKHKIKSNY